VTTFVTSGFDWGNTNATTPSVATYQLRLQTAHDAFIGAGLIQTSDTGQLDISAIASVPAVNNYSGYRIYRFNDSRQGTDPLFIKVEFGSGDGQSYTCLRVSTGTGTNGAGTLTGQVSNLCRFGGSYTGTNGTITACQYYATHSEGFFGFLGAPNNNVVGFPEWAFTIARTKDVAGSFDSLGNIITHWDGHGNTAGSVSFTRTLNNQFSQTATSHYCIVPGIPTDSALLNGDKQLYPHFYADPDVRQMWHQCSVNNVDFAAPPASFTATILHGVSRTVLSGGNLGAPKAETSGGTSAYRCVFIWE
jgi:hypothetical protein